MVRGRGFPRGSPRMGNSSYRGGGGGSYRRGGSSYHHNSDSNYHSGSNRNFNSSFKNSRNYGSNDYSKSYDSRSRGKHSDRDDNHKRSYTISSRDRSPDRKRSRHEDSRMNSSYSSYRRNDSSRSHQTPPPPPAPSVRIQSSYRHRDESSHSHRRSVIGTMGQSSRTTSSFNSSRMINSSRGARNTGGNNFIRGRRPIRGIPVSSAALRRREAIESSLKRRRLILMRSKDHARKLRITKLSSRRSERSERTHKSSKNKKEDGNESKCEDWDDKDDKEKGQTCEENWEDDDGGNKSDVKEKKIDKKDVDETNNKDKTDEKDEEESSKLRKTRSKFIKLACVHCGVKCVRFKDYSDHLYSRGHQVAMRRLAQRQKMQVLRMRAKQRATQRDIEENSEEKGESQFCLLCKLNYRQSKSAHQASEAHRGMKKFLMPYCSTCRIAFRSPMMYQTHRASLDHIKRKAHKMSMKNDSCDEKEVDLKDFTTVDSVGEIDGPIDDDNDAKDDRKERENVGVDQVKKMEAFYCNVCHFFFPIKETENENSLKKHCASRSHLKAYLKYKRAENERLDKERKQKDDEEEEEETKLSDKDNNDNDNNENNTENGENGEVADDNEEIDEAYFEEIGDLLSAVEANERDDDDDGSVLNINIESYGRSRKRDKKDEIVNGKSDENESKNETNKMGETKKINSSKGKTGIQNTDGDLIEIKTEKITS